MGRKGIPADREYCITGGRNSCPPDDVGGIYGYEHMLGVPGNPEDEEYQEYKDWLYEGFNPELFSIQEARLRCRDFERTVGTVRMRMSGCIPPEIRMPPQMKRQQSVPESFQRRMAERGGDKGELRNLRLPG